MKNKFKTSTIIMTLALLFICIFFYAPQKVSASDNQTKFVFSVEKNKKEDAITVTFEKISGIKEYAIQIKSDLNAKFKTVKKYKNTGSNSCAYTIKNLEPGTYTIRIKRKEGQRTIYGKAKKITLKLKAKENHILINSEIFPDYDFRQFVLNNIDTDGDRQLSDEEIKNTTSLVITSKYPAESLDGLEVFYNLKKLTVTDKYIYWLDVRKNTMLEELDCSGIGLTKLKLGKNKALTYINCSKNKIKEINLSGVTALETLNCRENELTELDLSKNTALTYLECRENNLDKNLDLTHNLSLEALFCSFSGARYIDLGKNTKIKTIFYYDQYIYLDPKVNLDELFLREDSKKRANSY